MLYLNNCFLDYEVRKNITENIKIEMSEFESAFLCGLLKQFRPKNIMEVGVAAGGTTTILLAAIKKYCLDANIDSYDYNSMYYRDKTKPTGYIAREYFPDSTNWEIKTGNFLPVLIDDIQDKKYDFIIIDTVHQLPGEILDYLVAIQYAKPNAILVLHDYHLHFYSSKSEKSYCNKVLFDSLVGNKIICLDQNSDKILPNIAACELTSDSYKYIENIFLILGMPWGYMIDKQEYEIYYNFYARHYNENMLALFSLAYKNNDILLKRSKQKTSDDLRQRKILLSIYSQLLLANNNNFPKPIFSEIYTYFYLPINDEKNIHYELSLYENSAYVSLHFEGKYSQSFDFRKEIMKRSKLEIPLESVDLKSISGLSYRIKDCDDYNNVVHTMQYLIDISLPVLREHNLVYWFI